MTISRKDRMLHIILQLEAFTDQLSEQTKDNLTQAKETLNQMDEAVVEQLTNKVVSKPAPTQGINISSPENLLHACYEELNRLSRNSETPNGLQKAVEDMRNYFFIEEQDGFFP